MTKNSGAALLAFTHAISVPHGKTITIFGSLGKLRERLLELIIVTDAQAFEHEWLHLQLQNNLPTQNTAINLLQQVLP